MIKTQYIRQPYILPLTYLVLMIYNTQEYRKTRSFKNSSATKIFTSLSPILTGTSQRSSTPSRWTPTPTLSTSTTSTSTSLTILMTTYQDRHHQREPTGDLTSSAHRLINPRDCSLLSSSPLLNHPTSGTPLVGLNLLNYSTFKKNIGSKGRVCNHSFHAI